MTYERLPRSADRRVKLTPEDRQTILERYKNPLDNTSIRGLARDFGVDKNTIKFIVDPEAYEKHKQARAERIRLRGSFYDREKHTEYMRRHRAHRKKVLGHV